MELEEAREIIKSWLRGDGAALFADVYTAVALLNDQITELEGQRDELLRAGMGVLRIVQNTYHADNRGPNDQCSVLENAIEKATGKKWWDASKTEASDKEIQGEI